MLLGTLFNIIGFGSSIQTLFDKSQEYNNKTLQAAVAHVDKMTANLGGTNILSVNNLSFFFFTLIFIDSD